MAAVVLLCMLAGVFAGGAWAYTGLERSEPEASTRVARAAPTSVSSATTEEAVLSAAATPTEETVLPAPTTTTTTVSTTTTSLLAARLVRVIDGDTIVVKLANGKQERVALMGIDAPEGKRKGSKEATAYIKQLLASGPLGLTLGRDVRDKYNRLRAYVHAGSVFVNQEMVAKGMAKATGSGDNPDYEQAIADAQASAKSASQAPRTTTTTR